MKVSFFGHAAVGLRAGGIGVLLDPYEPQAFGGRIKYSAIPGRFDVVVISHEHLDHNHVAPSFGNPHVVRGPCTFAGLDFRCLVGAHGDAAGTVDFETRITRFVLDDVAVVHPGDLGAPLSAESCAVLGDVDLLFVPVGGHFTMGPEGAREMIAALRPKVAIPIHYKTPFADLAIGPLQDFLDLAGSIPVRRFASGEIDISADSLPVRTEIWVLPPVCTHA